MSQNLLNGVDVAALGGMIAAVVADPEIAKFEFRSATDWKAGAEVVSTFTGHKQRGVDSSRETPHQLPGDEPVALLGGGKYAGPSGHLLHSLCHCLTVTTAYHGAARGVKIDSLRVEAEGSVDLQGFLGLNGKIRPGFKQIHLKTFLDSPNSPEEVVALYRFTQSRSPICSTVRHQVPISWEFEIEATDAAPDTGEDRHGVNYSNLAATVQAVQEAPVMAKCKFYTVSEWLGGAKMKSTHPGFDQGDGPSLIRHRDEEPRGYTGDEPAALLGSDAGPSPAETLLHAMANCVAVTTSYHSAARGIPLDAFQVNLEGDIDVQGFADLDDRVTPGYQTIRGKVRIKAGGKKEEIEEFLKFVSANSPICESVSRPVDISFSLVHNGVAVS